MLVVCSPIFVVVTKIIFRYDFVAPLMTPIDSTNDQNTMHRVI